MIKRNKIDFKNIFLMADILKPYPAYKDSGVEWLGRCRALGC
jgi:hypothetical protein